MFELIRTQVHLPKSHNFEPVIPEMGQTLNPGSSTKSQITNPPEPSKNPDICTHKLDLRLIYNLDGKCLYHNFNFIFVCLQPRLVILTKAKMATMEILATMATSIMPTIKQCFTMMPTLKLDSNLAHQITSIIIQKVSNLQWLEIYRKFI